MAVQWSCKQSHEWFNPTLSYSSTLPVCSNQVTESHYLQQQLDSYNASRLLAQLSLLNIIAMVVVIFSLLLLLLLLLLNKSRKLLLSPLCKVITLTPGGVQHIANSCMSVCFLHISTNGQNNLR